MGELSDLAGRRVLVTGGSGFIGARVVALGVARGAQVTAVSREGAAVPGARSLAVDLRDADAVARAVRLAAPAAILHLAAAGVCGDALPLSELVRVNVLGLANLLDAARDLVPGPDIVISGSGAEYAPQDRPISEADPVAPVTAYGIAKSAASLCAAWYASAMPVTILRFFNVYGEGESRTRLIPTIVRDTVAQRPVRLTSGEQLRDFVHVDDAATCMWRALERPAAAGSLRVLNVGSGAPVRLRAFVEAVLRILRDAGHEPQVVFGARPLRPGEAMTYVADTARVRMALAWTPTIAMDDGLRRAVESLL